LGEELSSPFFYFGGIMLENLLYLITGMIITLLFNYVLGIGASVLILKQVQKSCAILFVTSAQGLQEILELKYMAMREANRSDQNVMAQRYIDQMNIDSIKATIMKNYTNVFPSSYENIMEFSNWKELEKYVNNTFKRN
jgi:hypothetical protein